MARPGAHGRDAQSRFGGDVRGTCGGLALGSLALLAGAAVGMLASSHVERLLAARSGALSAAGEGGDSGPRLADYVNVFAGSFPGTSQLSEGNTLPLVARPWGFNHWGPQGYPLPMSREEAWWFRPDPAHPGRRAHGEFYGIRCTHQPSPWIGDYAPFVLTPVLHNRTAGGSFDKLLYEGTQEQIRPYMLRANMSSPPPVENKYGRSPSRNGNSDQSETRNADAGGGSFEFTFAPTSHAAVARVRFLDGPARGAPKRLRFSFQVGTDSVSVNATQLAPGIFLIVSRRLSLNSPTFFAHVRLSRIPRVLKVLRVPTAANASDKSASARILKEALEEDSGSAVLKSGEFQLLRDVARKDPISSNRIPRGGQGRSRSRWRRQRPNGDVLIEMPIETEEVTLRIGTSLISGEFARRALELEVGTRSVYEIGLEGAQAWGALLSRAKIIEVGGGRSEGPILKEAEAMRYEAQKNQNDLQSQPMTKELKDPAEGSHAAGNPGALARAVAANRSAELLASADLLLKSLNADEDAREALKTAWYTAAYRAYLFPRFLDELDENRKYVHWSPYTLEPQAAGRLVADQGFWDSHRTLYPWLGLIQPKTVGAMLEGWLVAASENNGWVPQWASPGVRSCGVLHKVTMSDVTLADAVVKRTGGFNETAAMLAMFKSVDDDGGVTEFQGRTQYLALMQKYGYIPADAVKPPEPSHRGGVPLLNASGLKGQPRVQKRLKKLQWVRETHLESVSMSLNLNYADWAVAQAARALCKRGIATELSCTGNGRYPSLANELERRANQHSLLFHHADGHPANKSFQRRNADRAWKTQPLNYWGHGFTEAGPYQYRYYLPFNVTGLNQLYGGRLCEQMEKDLKDPFDADANNYWGGIIHEVKEAAMVGEQGFGQLAHSNQPSHFWLHMMRVASPKTTPECTQRAKGWIRSALTRLYTPWGYAGDEDNGEMAAWYLLSASGLYPLTLGSDQFVLGAPLFKHLEVTVGEPPRKLSITTRRRAVFGEGGVDALWRSSSRPGRAVSLTGTVAQSMLVQGGELTFLEDADYDPVPEVRKVLADLRGGRQVLRDRAAVRKRVVQRAEMAAKAKRASNQPLVRSAQFQMVKNKMAARDAMWVRNSAPNQRTLGGPRLASVRPT